MKAEIFARRVFLLIIFSSLLFFVVGCSEQADNPVTSSDFEGSVVQNSGLEAVNVDAEIVEYQSELLAAPSFPKIKLDVPFIPQVPPGEWSNTKNCGQAAVLNSVGYLRRQCMTPVNITYENNWLANAYGDSRYRNPNGWYTDVYKLENLAKNYWGYYNSRATTSNLDGLYSELKACRSVVVAVRLQMSTTPTPTNGHFMVLVGMDSSYVWVNDVGKTYGKNNSYPLWQFEASWKTQNNSCVFIR